MRRIKARCGLISVTGEDETILKVPDGYTKEEISEEVQRWALEQLDFWWEEDVVYDTDEN